MDQNHPKFKKLESCLSFIVEQLNQDVNYLRECDLETQKKHEYNLEKVIRRICLESDYLESDISFLHEEFQEYIKDYEELLEKEFSFEERQNLSSELLEQLQPDDFSI